jgi:Domain of unknown function (DUF4203)
MLPASLQMPAAIVLVLGGLLSCFAGYRVFRIVLGVYGFILGALIASSVMGTDQTVLMVVGAIVGGLLGALILIATYFVGVALIGAGAGALLANLIGAAVGREPHLLVVIGLAVVGALLALVLQRYVIIVSTAFGGAWTAIVGAAALIGDRTAEAAARSDVWLAYPMNPAPGQQWVTVLWLGMGLVGTVVQLVFTAPAQKKKGRR